MLLLVLLATMSADTRAFHVIVNRANAATSLTEAEVSAMFMKRLRSWPDGSDVAPVDQRAGSRVRESFSEEIHGKSVRYVIRYWHRLIFSGRGIPPRELESDEDVLAFVAANRGAIGYVNAGAALPDDVQVLAVSP
ncbi:MAG TPA: substrate-binding domain-containing protein [Thermoanaerobaculia bacterium]|nr:substrate-binding domain-containing protein [Thermoanaerobaculia bacterium]